MNELSFCVIILSESADKFEVVDGVGQWAGVRGVGRLRTVITTWCMS